MAKCKFDLQASLLICIILFACILLTHKPLENIAYSNDMQQRTHDMQQYQYNDHTL